MILFLKLFSPISSIILMLSLKMLETVGLPENDRLYLGMTGFRAIIDIHGNLIELKQPTGVDPDEE